VEKSDVGPHRELKHAKSLADCTILHCHAESCIRSVFDVPQVIGTGGYTQNLTSSVSYYERLGSIPLNI
jgi:hypothetical protein